MSPFQHSLQRELFVLSDAVFLTEVGRMFVLLNAVFLATEVGRMFVPLCVWKWNYLCPGTSSSV